MRNYGKYDDVILSKFNHLPSSHHFNKHTLMTVFLISLLLTH